MLTETSKLSCKEHRFLSIKNFKTLFRESAEIDSSVARIQAHE